VIYDVVNIQLTHPSFKSDNGLYIVVEKTEKSLKMCRLDNNYKPYLYDDGKFMISCTGTNNKEVYPTGLKYKHNDNLHNFLKT
jgi:hypothetical protein